MKLNNLISLRFKIVLLPVSILFVATLLYMILLIFFIERFYKNEAENRTKESLAVFNNFLDEEQLILSNNALSFTKDIDIVSSLNLITNYQDKYNYNKLIFNNEKLKLLDKFIMFGKSANFDSAYIYDKSGDVVISYLKSENIGGIREYHNGVANDIFYQNGNKELKVMPPEIEFSSIDRDRCDKINDNKLIIFNNKLITSQCQKIIKGSSSTNSGEEIGYIVLSFEVGEKIIEKLKRVANIEFLISSTPSIKVKEKEEINLSSSSVSNFFGEFDRNRSEILESSDYFISPFYLEIEGAKIYILSLISKDSLRVIKKEIETILFIIFGAVLALVIPLSIFFANNNIILPINRLLEKIEMSRDESLSKASCVISMDMLKKRKRGKDELLEVEEAFVEMSMLVHEAIQKLQNTNKNLRAQVEKEVLKAREKDEIIYKQNKQQAITELLINIAHQWRQPLNGVALTALNIEDAIVYNDFSVEDVKKQFALINSELQKLSSTITNFTQFFQEKSVIEGMISIKDSVDMAMNFLQTSIEMSNLTIKKDIDSDIKVLSTQGDLVEIALALILNVIDIAKTDESKKFILEIFAKLDGDDIVWSFRDNAGGVDEKIIDSIFEPYITTHFKSPNKGLGLYIIKNIIEYRLKGTIDVTNIDNGAIFKVKIPKS